MKITTIDEINILREAIASRKSRVEGLTKLLKAGVSYETYQWIREEIAEHEKFFAEAKKTIADFYKPAIAA